MYLKNYMYIIKKIYIFNFKIKFDDLLCLLYNLFIIYYYYIILYNKYKLNVIYF